MLLPVKYVYFITVTVGGQHPIFSKVVIRPFPMKGAIHKPIIVRLGAVLLGFSHKENDFVVPGRGDNAASQSMITAAIPQLGQLLA